MKKINKYIINYNTVNFSPLFVPWDDKKLEKNFSPVIYYTKLILLQFNYGGM